MKELKQEILELIAGNSAYCADPWSYYESSPNACNTNQVTAYAMNIEYCPTPSNTHPTWTQVC